MKKMTVDFDYSTINHLVYSVADSNLIDLPLPILLPHCLLHHYPPHRHGVFIKDSLDTLYLLDQIPTSPSAAYLNFSILIIDSISFFAYIIIQQSTSLQAAA